MGQIKILMLYKKIYSIKGGFNLSLKIQELPELERPYEKLEIQGEKVLSNAELLAIIIKSGTKNETSVQIAQKILKLGKEQECGDLNFLKAITLEELKQIKGIGKVKAIQLKAVAELAIRMSKPYNVKKVRIKNTSQLANLLLEDMRFKKNEIVKLFLLNNINQIIGEKDIAIGQANFANISVKDLIYEAIKINAPKMILVHNHPSGDPTPSRADIQMTDKIYNIANSFNIELLDHIVIGNMNFKSVFEATKELVDNIKEDGIL